MTRREKHEYEGETRGEARVKAELMPIIKEKDEQLQKAEKDKLETAKRLLTKGLSMEDVVECTGLDYSVVNKFI